MLCDLISIRVIAKMEISNVRQTVVNASICNILKVTSDHFNRVRKLSKVSKNFGIDKNPGRFRKKGVRRNIVCGISTEHKLHNMHFSHIEGDQRCIWPIVPREK